MRLGRRLAPGAAEPRQTLQDYLAEAEILGAWLARRGLTAHEAPAAGPEGPPGLRWASVGLFARAEEDVAIWRWTRTLEAAEHCEVRALQLTAPGFERIAEECRGGRRALACRGRRRADAAGRVGHYRGRGSPAANTGGGALATAAQPWSTLGRRASLLRHRRPC